MFYIVRVYDDTGISDFQYDDLGSAQSHMASESSHAELYAVFNGREEYMESVN